MSAWTFVPLFVVVVVAYSHSHHHTAAAVGDSFLELPVAVLATGCLLVRGLVGQVGAGASRLVGLFAPPPAPPTGLTRLAAFEAARREVL